MPRFGFTQKIENIPAKYLILAAFSLLILAVVGIFFVQNQQGVANYQYHVYLLSFLVALAACGCEFVDSSLGMGYGTTLTPILLLAGFEPLQVVPAILVSELCTGIFAGLSHQHEGNIDLLGNKTARTTTVILASLSVLGATAAVFLALKISKRLLGTVIGTIVVLMGIIILLTIKQNFRFKVWHIIVLGAVAAFNKGLSGGGYGPLVTGGQVVCGVSPKEAVGITSLAEAATCLVALIVYFASGQHLTWNLVIPMVVGGMLSVPFSVLTVKHLTAMRVRAAIGVGTLLLGCLSLGKIWL